MSIFDTPAPPAEGNSPDAGVAAPVTPTPPMPDQGAAVTPPPPAESGVVEGQPTPQYLDTEQYKDHLVKVKIGGEDKELPFGDALNSVMMQQDYTRKTQELAEERRRLRQADALVAALEANPADTLKQLSEAYDLDPVQGFNRMERAPEEQAQITRQRELVAQEQQIQRMRIDAELAQIKATQPDVDVAALADYAYNKQLPLPIAHQLMQFEQMQAKQTSESQAQQRAQAAQAAQVVHGGAGTQRGTVSTAAKPVTSIREAWMAAKNAHA